MQLAKIGNYIDQVATGQVVSIALDYEDTQLLPGVSAHTNLISFREEKLENGHNFFMSPEEIQERVNASTAIRSLDTAIPVEGRCATIEKYKLKYVVVEIEKATMFSTYVADCLKDVEVVFRTREMLLFELK